MSWFRELLEQAVREQREHYHRVEGKLDALNNRFNELENTMSKELNDAVARITASSKRLIDDAVAKLSQPDPDVAAAITSLNAASDALDTESGSLEGAGATGTTGSPQVAE